MVTVRVTDTDGNLLNGIVAFEKGFVHKNRFILGTLVTNGKANIELPKVRDIPEVEWNYWGMHVYATNTIYFPKEIEIIPGEDYEFEIALAPEPNPDDDPVISTIEFDTGAGKATIKVDISSPKDQLGPQNLALNTQTGEVFALEPPSPVASLRDNFPNGIYTLRYPDATTDPRDWYFVVADHSCSNGPLQGYPVNENIIPAMTEGEAPTGTETPTGTAVELGAQLVSKLGCGACHYFDRESRFEDKETKTNWLIGPGLKSVLKKEKLPASGREATDENVKLQIIEGGGGMPPYSHLSEEEISNIIGYLDSL
jgi:mono/diheme cytochrome c family protein